MPEIEEIDVTNEDLKNGSKLKIGKRHILRVKSIKNFIILFGGPALYRGFDPHHDKSWKSYFYPIEIYGKTGKLTKRNNEHMHWCIFEPAYTDRWNDDDITGLGAFIDDAYKKLFGDSNMSRHRNNEAEKLKDKYENYIDYINRTAKTYQEKYEYIITTENIKSPTNFYDKLKSFKEKSISRVWYFGHGIDDGLILRLNPERSAEDPTSVLRTEMLLKEEIIKYKNLKDKFDYNTKQSSCFFACNSNAFAKEWNRIFKIPTSGAIGTIDFGIAMQAGTTYDNVLEKLKKNVIWKQYE